MRGTFGGGPPNMRGASIFRYDIFEKMRQAGAQGPDGPLSDFFAFAPIYELTAVVNEHAEIVTGQAVSGGYYAGVGVEPLLGRQIADADDNAAAPPVVVLSHKYWQERFAANPAVIGQELKLNKTLFTIVGVTPPAFTGTLQVDQHPAVTVPLSFEPLLLGERSGMAKAGKPGIWWIALMGRLKPGATLEQARDSLNATFESIALEVMPAPRRIPLISHYMYNTGVRLPGEAENSESDHVSNRQMVRENYFSTMEFRCCAGAFSLSRTARALPTSQSSINASPARSSRMKRSSANTSWIPTANAMLKSSG